MMKNNSHFSKKSFSLVEVLVVISIIAILAGILTVALDESNDNKMHMETRGEISKIEMAINQYNLDTGEYPQHSGYLKDFLSLSYLKSFEEFKTTDGWGNELYYFSHDRYNTVSVKPYVAKKVGTTTFYNHRSFQIISCGKDGLLGEYFADSATDDEAKDNIANYEIKE